MDSMNLKDLPVVGPGNGNGGSVEDHSCKACHESWAIPPTSQEIKRGMIDSVLVCLAKPFQQQLPDGSYPRLAILCRSDKSLCGGRHWKPIGLPLIAEVPEPFNWRRSRAASALVAAAPTPVPTPTTVSKHEASGDDEDRRDAKRNKSRRPYKVN